MPPTIETIEKALGDIQKGMATKDEVKELITEVVASEMEQQAEQQKALQTSLDTSDASIKELQDANADLQKQLKAVLQSVRGPDGNYKGMFHSPDEAKAFGLFVMGRCLGHTGARKSFDELGYESKALIEGDNTQGGATVPPEFLPRLIDLVDSLSVYADIAERWPMGSDRAIAMVLTSDPTVESPGEGTAASESEPGFKGVELIAKKFLSYVPISSEVSEDSAIALGELVGRLLARATAIKLDAAGLVGDGTSTYQGILGIRHQLRAVDATIGNCQGLQVQATAGAWSAIVAADLYGVVGLLPSFADTENTCFVTHRTFYYTVMIALALAAGGTLASEIINVGYTRKPTFLGYPVKFSTNMPRVKPAADHCPLMFGDFKQACVLGERSGFDIAESDHVKFAEDMRCIRGRLRAGVNNHGVGDTTNPGPAVGLWADIA